MQGAGEPRSLLEFRGVEKTFRLLPTGRTVRALAGVSFEVGPGRILGLVGPNGSGKTTSFRIAAGLLKADRGAIRILGKAPGSTDARTLTGYMPEEPGLPGTLTPRELLDFLGRIFSMKPDQRSERIGELEGLLAMSGYMDRRMGGLSKGMSKRVGLAAALFNRPRLLLLDEPLEGLDPLGAAWVKEHLQDLAQQGTGIIISSHILSDVETICEEIIILDEGRVILQGLRDAILAVRDRMEIRFEAPAAADLAEEIARLIESRGGKVEFAGHPRQGLEPLFKRLVAEDRGGAPDKGRGQSAEGREGASAEGHKDTPAEGRKGAPGDGP